MRKTVLVLFILLVQYASANITLPKIFGDNMVLQREKPIPVWGWAQPG
jgi:sialate O-acetylesterase